MHPADEGAVVISLILPGTGTLGSSVYFVFTVSSTVFILLCRHALRVSREDGEDTTRRMKQEACQDRLLDWFEENKIIWVTLLAALAAIQLMVTIIAAYIIQKVKKISKMRYIFHFSSCVLI